MNEDQTAKFKKILEEELGKLEKELHELGFKNPNNPADWEPKPDELNILPQDENEIADTIEEFEENSAILKQLEIRYNDVKAALGKIAEGTYGICEVSGEQIPVERLEANPAARTLTAYANQIDTE
jgi:RNA polymerase-binding transcription factor DksA